MCVCVCVLRHLKDSRNCQECHTTNTHPHTHTHTHAPYSHPHPNSTHMSSRFAHSGVSLPLNHSATLMDLSLSL